MDGLLFKGYRAIELHYRNDIQGDNIQLVLEHQVKTKANFHKNEKTCECFYDLTVIGKEEETILLQAHVLIAGLFDYPDCVDFKLIHVDAANELYPFARAALVGLTSIAAIAPLPWPHKQIRVEDLVEEKNEN